MSRSSFRIFAEGKLPNLLALRQSDAVKVPIVEDEVVWEKKKIYIYIIPATSWKKKKKKIYIIPATQG
jgi:hypothetical protein